jgi:hypothetical protein
VDRRGRWDLSEIIKGSQVVYGWVEKGSKKGHQMVTKSSAVEESDIQFLDNHSIPASLNNITFKECRRFFKLPNGKYTFNYIKNIGKDTYGREGALISHFIIFTFNDLKILGKNFYLVDSKHLKGISSVNDLLKLKVGNDFITLPEITIDVEGTGKPNFPEDITKEIVYPLLLSMNYGETRLVLRNNGYSDVFDMIINLEKVFPGTILFSYSTSIFDFIADDFIQIGITDSNTRLTPKTYVLNMDGNTKSLLFSSDGSWDNLEVIENGNDILWQIARMLEKFGNGIIESMNTRIGEINRLNSMENMYHEYLRMLVDTYFDFLMSEELDINSGLIAIFDGMEERIILSRDQYLNMIQELIKEHPNLISDLINLYIGAIKNTSETADVAMKAREIISMILQYSRKLSDIETFSTLYKKEPKLYKSNIIPGIIANLSSSIVDRENAISSLFSSIPDAFDEWYKSRLKEQISMERLNKYMGLMEKVDNSSKQMFLLYKRAVDEAIKHRPEDIEKLIGIMEKYHRDMKSDDIRSVCKTLISALSKSSSTMNDYFIQRLQKLGNLSANEDEESKSTDKQEKRGFFSRKKE